MYLICIGLVLSTWGSACRQPTPPPGDFEPYGPAPAANRSDAIDPDRLRPGDRFLDLRIEEMDLRPDPVDSVGWTGSVHFSGVLRLAGRYEPHPSYPEVQELCFYPDSASAPRLPRLPNDVRISWFCFSNQEQARVAFGALPTSGEATIILDEYDYRYEHTDTYNTGRLREVVP